MKCPYCQNIIDDDSRWCDQCGKELMFCPSCREPGRARAAEKCWSAPTSSSVTHRKRPDSAFPAAG